MHKPNTRRIRSRVDASLVHCHGGCEFESCHLFFVFVFVFRFYILMNQFICLFIDIIHYYFQTILVAEYRFNDIKRY